VSQHQFELLERVPLRNAPALEAAKAAGVKAGEHCLAKAEDVANFDSAGAAKFILGWLRRYGPTSGEGLTTACCEHGFKPHDLRAMGPVFAKLIKAGDIKVLRSDLPRSRGHGTAGGRLYGVGKP